MPSPKSVTLPAMPSTPSTPPKLDLDAAMNLAHKRLAELKSQVLDAHAEIDRLIQLKHVASRPLP